MPFGEPMLLRIASAYEERHIIGCRPQNLVRWKRRNGAESALQRGGEKGIGMRRLIKARPTHPIVALFTYSSLPLRLPTILMILAICIAIPQLWRYRSEKSL